MMHIACVRVSIALAGCMVDVMAVQRQVCCRANFVSCSIKHSSRCIENAYAYQEMLAARKFCCKHSRARHQGFRSDPAVHLLYIAAHSGAPLIIIQKCDCSTMAESGPGSISLKASAVATTLHWLPCKINQDGHADIDSNFCPDTSSSDQAGGSSAGPHLHQPSHQLAFSTTSSFF